MAVLIEGISIVIRTPAVLSDLQGGWDAFAESIPNETLCVEPELTRVGFMTTPDVAAFSAWLERRGLNYLVDGTARDFVVVDQLRGLCAASEWLTFGHVNLSGDPKRRVAACRQRGSTLHEVMLPDGWTFEDSLSNSFAFVRSGELRKSMTLADRHGGMETYYNHLSGDLGFVGRTSTAKLD